MSQSRLLRTRSLLTAVSLLRAATREPLHFATEVKDTGSVPAMTTVFFDGGEMQTVPVCCVRRVHNKDPQVVKIILETSTSAPLSLHPLHHSTVEVSTEMRCSY